MTINGKRGDFTLEDFRACGQSALLKRGHDKTILNKVRDVVSRWRDYADEAGVNSDRRDKIQNLLRLATFE
ncbi:MAG: type II toxin-antitoxin system HipA family toxin, partial [Planctomycetota bacterium]|nr:type II toxin-antitoxin system HipA family toxin [Planctomycetota bacterium]